MIELFETNPIASIAGIATIIGAIVAVLAYFRRDDGLRVGGDSRFRARDISGSSVTINTGAIDSFNQVDYSKEDQRSEWKVYEVAFLWHDLEPPGTGAHFQQMSREVEATKEILHNAANQGVLPIAREVRFPQGMTRWVSRDDLIHFAQARGERPKFLFPDER